MLALLIRSPTGVAMDVYADGQLDLPKQPPFEVLTPGPAAVVQVQIEPESPDRIRVLNFLYFQKIPVDVTAYDGRRCIQAEMQCTHIEWHLGIQITRAWSPPMRMRSGQLYRPQPIYQPIARDVRRYVLTADRWAEASPLSFRSQACLQ